MSQVAHVPYTVEQDDDAFARYSWTRGLTVEDLRALL
jgi:hypothetical protein